MATAFLKNYKQSPRKVRLVVDLVRGKKVKDALNILSVTTRRSSLPIKKLIESAVANAVNNFQLF
jgi:large subunit ribosomal protein L22